ncbi:hypothetical protein F2Q68_00025814 [Brassica cretica]|uniref:Arabidopsis retrotransposon Orf1 C-terminal domain-containing protein n=1 Tax=Brassica cretica TaxID=69181 RepID=A0A8S9IL85_BRACR|nr:hypothetical protein F2Q68_00025814 [Brassica cretica]
MADERRTKRRFDTNRPAHVRDRDPWPRQPEDGPIPLFENFPDTRKAVSIEPTRFVDPDVVRALGIRSDLEDLFVELGMGNFATHPLVLYPELVRQLMATVNVYYTHERAKKASEGVLTFFIRGVRYRVSLLTLCTIYGFETEHQHATVIRNVLILATGFRIRQFTPTMGPKDDLWQRVLNTLCQIQSTTEQMLKLLTDGHGFGQALLLRDPPTDSELRRQKTKRKVMRKKQRTSIRMRDVMMEKQRSSRRRRKVTMKRKKKKHDQSLQMPQ